MILNKKEHRENWLYEHAGASDLSESSKAWTSLWHTRVPSKVKVFLWRLARHSMPTADLLQHRNMSTTHLCALCGCEDSWRHALLECTMSRCIWALADEALTEKVSQNQEIDAKNWLFSMHDKLPEKDFVLLVVTLWAVWRTIRKVIYEDIF